MSLIMTKSKDGTGHKDEYFNFGSKISSSKMFMWHTKSYLSLFKIIIKANVSDKFWELKNDS